MEKDGLRKGERGIGNVKSGEKKKTEKRRGGKMKERRKKVRIAGDMKAEFRADLSAFHYRHNISASVCLPSSLCSHSRPLPFGLLTSIARCVCELIYRTELEGIPF